ncbi:chromosome partitioning protein, ParB family [Sphingomonas laterariae]|uniref:Chromosome partitioning protein, ParB family n=1 Tax=Edaphosphingomonas laterariae TaxID=861865 RepID=A0A239GIW5_9SPHN|nr:ParB/RepB/Spo0J family partition protein [Sphingomonas laterariae]SNS69089.1 chromosome partitioning protein, ParB family [Sphingomonas laterariae]
MTFPILYVPAVNCRVAEDNVRKHSNADADAQFEAHLGETGIVLQNLIGVPIKRRKDHYDIYAGGRRLSRTLSNIEKGVLPKDFQVPVMVVPNAADAISMSLAENFFQLAMNPADACTAFRTIIDKEKKTVADIAKRFSLTVRFVEGRLRLANLATPVFEALARGEITLDIAKAYAKTSDPIRQAAVFESLAGTYYANNVAEIERQVTAGSYNGGHPKALLVGRDAYLAAGGTIDRDLYSNAESELWTNRELLDQLADEALAEAAEAIREREGFAEVRAIAATHVPYTATMGLRRIDGVLAPLTEEQEARQQAIKGEIDKIEEAASDIHEYSDEQLERIDELEEELGAIQDRQATYEPEQKARALAYVVIGEDGRPVVEETLFIAEPDEEDEDIDPEADGDDGDVADAAETPRKASLSQKLVDRLALMRTELVALHVANDPHFAMDLGTFIMVDGAHRKFGGAYDLASGLKAPLPDRRVGNYVSETAAAESWAKLEGGLDHSWRDAGDAIGRFDAFRALADEARAAWFAWAIARTIEPVTDSGSGAPFLRHIGRSLDIDVARWWRPTARNFFDAVTRGWILDLFGEVGGEDLKSRYGASKKKDLAMSAEKLFAGDVLVEADVKEKALAWLPAPMRVEEPVIDAAQPSRRELAAAIGRGDGDEPLAANDSDEGDLAEAA